MKIQVKFIKNKIVGVLNPKYWKKNYPVLIHVTTHLYNGQKFFNDKNLVRYIKVVMFKTAVRYKINLLKIGCDYTHCHFVVRVLPDQDIKEVINLLKGNTSRAVRRRFEYLNQCPCFWAQGYYLKYYKESEIINVYKYIENQPRELSFSN